MFEDTIRDSFAGQFFRAVSKNKLYKYAEEKDGFVVPEHYKPGFDEKKQSRSRDRPTRDSDSEETIAGSGDNDEGQDKVQKGENGEIIVSWYGPDDPENPQNWTLRKKGCVTALVMLMTTTVYMGSSIYSPGVQDAMAYFGTSQIVTILGLSLFVAGYGIGPLFLSPLTEIPQIGRTLPYIITLFLFMILQIPTILVTNFAGFCILRFLAGFVGSPPLATGGASIQDMYSPHKMPYAMGLWGLAAGSAPAVAPVIAGFAVAANGWRWAFLIMLWLSAGSLIILTIFLPETSGDTILLRRARRLRKLTGNDNLKSQSEIDSAKMGVKEMAQTTMLKPFTLTFTEPIVLAINLYIGLIYAILYSYFESFPLVFGPTGYGWNTGVSTLPFLAILVGALVSYAIYSLWNRVVFEPKFHKLGGKVKPEERLPMSMLGALCFPICLFWFAWTSNRTSWVSPVIAASFFGLGTTWMFMPFLTYLPSAYPKNAASVLAANDFVRSAFGAGMPIAAVPLFHNLGIAWGNTLLGCCSVLFVPIPYVLYKYGGALRKRSPAAIQDDQMDEMEEHPDASHKRGKNIERAPLQNSQRD